MSKQAIGVVGLAVMGRNLALNIESRGHAVSVFNRSREKTDELIAEFPERKLVPAYTLEEFVASLEKPRRILLMVKAGEPTDATIAALKPLLEKGDILIDGGNTHFTDTIRRNQELAKAGLHFIGTGVSGGEEGALKGPSIMPGGQRDAYDLVAPILTEIAAKAPADGEPCVAYMGPDGAGHYVKMVHNGIEYGDMQLIAESYAVLKQVLGLSNEELGEVYTEWNAGELDSYLIEITSKIFQKKDDETGQYLVDVILDRAAQKGTGKWTSQNALDLGAPLPLITEAVFARVLSSLKTQRVAASKVLAGPDAKPFAGDRKAFIESVRRALYFSKVISYAQGFAQLRAASDEYKWDLQYGTIAKIFRAGCIIRARFLQKITDAYAKNAQLDNLLLDPYFSDIAANYQAALRDVVVEAVKVGVPVPAFSSAVAYFDAYRSERVPANLVQAQRDFFGAHTFERIDKPGSFHADWS
ncbi:MULTISPECIES: NADP-dependent phosphogluconate dehydrogenase [Paraburkholderia]|uniref:6-phosphogluconate dehydrogenase, decarboxylating n=1 Tax=Paraburkholderia tropica TaxID=92647 RepID=A0A1A5XM21_9BURK|nr:MULTISPECIES: NADP-dependent phosphogluconate dehydrogenase [Paraburkholderia]MBB2978471.1 6-phosphogluconate dehydrogenase [Paraburkholderia tropica]MBB2998665.1 6-phosphogluconate dehydrogenase [Paraburkholderia tropica]MBB6318560.1 6-phosphogluconate dehydrogenase [Paraburkholderia tropica]MDE1139477.1 NADP-dependent phosphogluconate dehydrogenase [Paraburkholderia tropica]OBR54472.1 phosphogluconate dehydrogenase (NADP(+)-dependent, decarboxylating) [Paraburkholderia tropica]